MSQFLMDRVVGESDLTVHNIYIPGSTIYYKNDFSFSILVRQGGCANPEAEVQSFHEKEYPTGTYKKSTTSDEN